MSLLECLDELMVAQGWPSCSSLLHGESGWINFCDMSQFGDDDHHDLSVHCGLSDDALESMLSGIHCGGYDVHIFVVDKKTATLSLYRDSFVPALVLDADDFDVPVFTAGKSKVCVK